MIFIFSLHVIFFPSRYTLLYNFHFLTSRFCLHSSPHDLRYFTISIFSLHDFRFLSSPLLLPLTIFVLLIYDFCFLTLRFPSSLFTFSCSPHDFHFLIFSSHHDIRYFTISIFSLHDFVFTLPLTIYVTLRFPFFHFTIFVFSLHLLCFPSRFLFC